MKEWKKHYLNDLKRYGDKSPEKVVRKILKYYRRCQFASNKFFKLLFKFLLKKYKNKRGIEIYGDTNIGDGLYIGHAYNITINPSVIIGENCNIHKGVLIGQENRGSRKGVPIIGNDVWIGINACIVGKITVGDDVLIAPNSFVNCDIPSHSVVFGNPCIIKHRDNATEGYINNKVG